METNDAPEDSKKEETPSQFPGEKIIPANINDEMEKAYLDYAMSVIVARALPAVNDGLKPVQRRIIYAMHKQGNTPTARYSKCASVVGETMKKYHPHGDLPIYDALVRMAQSFSMRYLLVDGQGNFGSVDGDPPAAMRYTECRLAPLSSELLEDIEKETVDFIQNYSGDDEEPVLLPAKLPNLLLNGAAGIAVGMATSIPPHNLTELIDAINFAIENPLPPKLAEEESEQKEPEEKTQAEPVFESAATLPDLLKFIKGPDFPTGGTIYDKEAIAGIYATGRGPVIMRAKTEIEEVKGGRFVVAIYELPYQVNKAFLVAKIAELVKDKKVEGISDLRDESDRRGMKVVVELKRDARPQQVLNLLFKHTELQKTFNANFVALVDGEPKTLTLKMILEEFIRHRQNVVIRRTIYLLKKAKEREHILLGLKIALDHLDEVIRTIRESADAEVAKISLMKKFGLSEIQAVAILDMQLRKLAALERKKIEEELTELLARIADLEDLLKSNDRILGIIKNELSQLKEKYGDARKTKVIAGKIGEFSEEELVAEEGAVVVLTAGGYIKRTNPEAYRSQGRGGKGVSAGTLKEEDQIYDIVSLSTHDNVFFFTDKGKVYKVKGWEIPEASRTAKGTPIVNVIDIAQGEAIRAILPIPQTKVEGSFLFMVTRGGTVKKTALNEFENIRKSGIIAISLSEGDELRWVKHTFGKNEIIMTTSFGQSIRFFEKDVRSMGRNAGGVIGMKLENGDTVVGTDSIKEEDVKDNKTKLLVISEKGYGKKTSLSEYRSQNRGGSGIKTMNVTDKTGHLVGAKLLANDEAEIMVTSKNGQIIKVTASEFSKLSRATQGVRIMKVDEGDQIAALACFEEDAPEPEKE